ncbi:phosphoribosyltransferase domain-containing protein [Streptomyces sp. NPDC004647]|uniref:phosphoribosyltransferase domain-containing protein n=1 Tax=Streptomyces sp. NPDC004647 TaxID=3154671 RepID=UPI0033BF0244
MVWSGQWVADRLDVGLAGDEQLTEMLGLALRRNPKRAHLLVSNVLGKHVPQRPETVYGAGLRLGERVRELLGDEAAARAVVLGYAETATGLGHSVADGLALAPYLHSTRRPVPGIDPAGGFEESHSHATSHLLLPEDAGLLAGGGPLVLVDDEFSTGSTIRNTIRDLHSRYPRDRYVVVTLVDMRSEEDRSALENFATELGARVDLVALAVGTVRLPLDVLGRGQELVAEHEAIGAGLGTDAGLGVEVGNEIRAGAAGVGNDVGVGARGGNEAGAGTHGTGADLVRVDLGWPDGLPDGGRHGFTPVHRTALEAALPRMARRVAAALRQGRDDPMWAAQAESGTNRLEPGRPERKHKGGRPEAAPRVLVLGFEELMYVPLRLAQALNAELHTHGVIHGVAHGDADGHPGSVAELDADPTPEVHAGSVADAGSTVDTRRPPDSAPYAHPGFEVHYSTTTRSPVLPVDDPGYAIRTRLSFPAHDTPADGPGERYAYNVAPGTDPARRFDAVVAVVDSAADTAELHAPGGLLAQLAAHTGRVVLAVVPSYVPDRQVPPTPPEPLRGPAFSSYAPDEVGWLLQDFSEVRLEAPTEEREEAVQRGGAHYAESLPVEYQPSEQYQELFRAALDTSAARIARAVGTVTETVLAERGASGSGERRPVLVSLARAGTPIGILMRRWAQHAHGLELPHYAISIVRGRGIDTAALRWLADHHDPADVVFVDGWTGKGAITRELADAVMPFPGFDPEIAVLADPGGCVRTYGTREDFLIPSACLNSTVSGLISRTVLRADLVGPDDFHGAKFYRELAGTDVSGLFIDTVAARFDDVADDVAVDVKELLAADRSPTWEGWAAVERISEEYGIHDVNLVKPGVGETTRVLLRRVPWRILARRGAGADLDHVRLLAEQRGVPVEEVDGLPYTCVGLIHPRYTRGATGADGRAVAAQ